MVQPVEAPRSQPVLSSKPRSRLQFGHIHRPPKKRPPGKPPKRMQPKRSRATGKDSPRKQAPVKNIGRTYGVCAKPEGFLSRMTELWSTAYIVLILLSLHVQLALLSNFLRDVAVVVKKSPNEVQNVKQADITDILLKSLSLHIPKKKTDKELLSPMQTPGQKLFAVPTKLEVHKGSISQQRLPPRAPHGNIVPPSSAEKFESPTNGTGKQGLLYFGFKENSSSSTPPIAPEKASESLKNGRNTSGQQNNSKEGSPLANILQRGHFKKSAPAQSQPLRIFDGKKFTVVKSHRSSDLSQTIFESVQPKPKAVSAEKKATKPTFGSKSPAKPRRFTSPVRQPTPISRRNQLAQRTRQAFLSQRRGPFSLRTQNPLRNFNIQPPPLNRQANFSRQNLPVAPGTRMPSTRPPQTRVSPAQIPTLIQNRQGTSSREELLSQMIFELFAKLGVQSFIVRTEDGSLKAIADPKFTQFVPIETSQATSPRRFSWGTPEEARLHQFETEDLKISIIGGQPGQVSAQRQRINSPIQRIAVRKPTFLRSRKIYWRKSQGSSMGRQSAMHRNRRRN
ncbi:unnamed protein product [Nippostrongylus brasiliensis]|uniref:Ras-associating domain-containing protein n=1 Tax=Nippostrongylus brasiliensis TaxID=27835 RepID=A0A0N4YKB2_NIPBR|nr:unnamed protein product [Nippostrongylus brasiliensis]